MCLQSHVNVSPTGLPPASSLPGRLSSRNSGEVGSQPPYVTVTYNELLLDGRMPFLSRDVERCAPVLGLNINVAASFHQLLDAGVNDGRMAILNLGVQRRTPKKIQKKKAKKNQIIIKWRSEVTRFEFVKHSRLNSNT